MVHVRKFVVPYDEDSVSDLKARVQMARFPDEGPGKSCWDYGLPLVFAKELQRYWVNEFSWKSVVEEMNRFDHFTCEMEEGFDQLKIHFIHEKPTRDVGRLPILMLHGWPGSFWEFKNVIPKLVAAGFPVVVPSLPGYGFSDKPQSKGYDTTKFAELFDSLMKSIGYSSYFGQGGDWGSLVCKALGSMEGGGCRGLHLNMQPCVAPRDSSVDLSDEDVKALAKSAILLKEGTGYQAIQGTRPQTLGYGLNDSPMGLACWIGEKLIAWSDPVSSISMNDLLANVCIYWFTGSITSSARLYYETLGLGRVKGRGGNRVSVPCSMAMLPHEPFVFPRPWVNAAFNVQRYSELSSGGHFACLEKPEELAGDIISFFSSLPRAKL